MNAASSGLEDELRALFRAMSFVSRHPALKRRSKEADRLAETYQLLGKLWEFLALQCKHKPGWRKTRDGKNVCRLCGTVRGVTERWLLLPRMGSKVIGRKLLPNSSKTFANKKAAQLVQDTIEFHGSRVSINVHNSYRSRLFRGSKPDINVAAERTVCLQEDGVECSVDLHLVTTRLRKHKPGERPPYGAFVWELPKRALKQFPVLIEYGKGGELVGVTIFRSRPASR
jgi:hypothetical protein